MSFKKKKKEVGVVRKNAWKKNDIEIKNTKLYLLGRRKEYCFIH